MDLNVIELFAGVGGFRVGLNHIKNIDKNGKAIENGDWNFVWSNQYEPTTKKQHAYECYTERFEKCSNIDINKVNKKEIPNHSLLVGGFPCQDYSVAKTLSNEMGITGKKGVLFWDIKDVIKEKQTPFVLLENVDRLLKSPSKRKGKDFAIMLKTFDYLGYYVIWRVINAADYGMPQRRKRVFIFAFKKNTEYGHNFKNEDNILNNNIFNNNFPIKDDKYKIIETNLNKYDDIVSVSDNFNDNKFLTFGYMKNGLVYHTDVSAKIEKIYPLSKIIETTNKLENKEDFIVKDDRLDRWKYLKGSKRIERTSKDGHKYFYSEGAIAFPDNIDKPARTLLTSESSINRSSHIIFDDNLKQYRTLTPMECELIQMFPINWTNNMAKGKRYFMMGNALVTGIISRLEPSLNKIIKEEK